MPIRRAAWSVVVVCLAVMGVTAPARGELTTSACLAKKLKEWGKLRKCQAAQNANALEGKPADPSRCQARFDAKLTVLSDLATAGGVACRYGANGDGTVTDYDTGLQWEQKTDDATVHDKDNTYTWNTLGGQPPSGTLFTNFLGSLNGASSSDGTTIAGCFAGHCDWRLPSVVELLAITDTTVAGCGSGPPCIDQAVFGPTVADSYWTGTSYTDIINYAWIVSFFIVNSGTTQNGFNIYARAVRSSL